MQKLDNKTFLYSPSDLTAFLGCRHDTYLAFKRCFGLIEKIPSSSSEKLLQRKGDQHEHEYLDDLKSQGLNVVEIEKDGDLVMRAQKTIDALKSGADVVFQGVFYDAPWRGDADFLVRVDTPSELGDFSYEVWDTKLARTTAGSHIIQLCTYSEMLSKIQGYTPQNMHIVLGDKRVDTFKLSDFQYYYMHVKESFENYLESLKSLPTLEDETLVEECQGGKYCKCKEHYAEQHEREGHLSLIANIKKADIAKLNDAGINTVSDLANMDIQNHTVEKMNPEILERLHEQAKLQLHKNTTGNDTFKTLKHERGKGFDRIPMADEGDLFFDMEGDPLHPGGLEYLFGVYYIQANGEPEFKAFWAHDSEQEKETFEEFMLWVGKHLDKYPNAYIYHYNHYETTALKRLAGRYCVCEALLDNLLRARKFVDLYLVVKEGIRTSEPKYSIKNMETFYMDKRTGDVDNAADSIVYYHLWRAEDDPVEKAKILQDISDYNEDDCISTKLLRDWLLSIRPKKSQWFNEINKNDGDDVTYSPEDRKEWELQYEAYQDKLSEYDDEIYQTVSDMLEFHRRAAKPQWWARFERQNKETHELIDDRECIANLTLTGEPEPEKRSLLYSYTFPKQEYKFKTGDDVDMVDNLEKAGELFYINGGEGLLKIKRGKSNDDPPEHMSICPTAPIDARIIRDAIYDYADTIMDMPFDELGNGLCTTEFLNMEIPKINGLKQGEKIIKNDLLEDSKKTIKGLEQSYMFIQGPPGAGKTYSSSHIILELLQEGKKVGISSNSHKAIHNLLKKVEELVKKYDLPVKGCKKASNGSKESLYKSEHGIIKNVFSTKDMPGSGELMAGTVYAFSHHCMENELDYLFVDEAGQVATANIVAMSRCATNLVLVGDQMQLGQPVQGTHPGLSGTSALEYLLADKSTIPPERGIFLSQSYRMHPDVCRFISDAFYNGRLTSAPVAANRTLKLTSSPLPNTGIAVIHTDHRNCSQSSEYEAQIIKEQYEALLGQKFINEDGEECFITRDDILIISPYNVQVNLLQDTIPDAKVGTVDKFQGQEAPIVLISMATSTPDDLPRDIEFLYSKNRLNVAISRSQCLSVIVMNPRLKDVTCKTPQQMMLLNTFCMLGYYADATLEK